jgi:hypothetical protein
MENKKITRRDLLKNTATFAIGSALYLNNPIELLGNSKIAKTRVVLIRDEKLPGYGVNPDPTLVKEMLNKALCSLLDEKDAAAA